VQSTDSKQFATMLAALCDYYQRPPLEKSVAAIYWDGLNGYEYQDVAKAAKAHMADPAHGDFFPKIADFMRHLKAARPSAHPGEDEAWALCVRMTGEEDTAVITAEMGEAWAIAWPVMELGDKVGARMAFKDAYANSISRSTGMPRWEIRPGSDRQIREMRVQEAVKAGRLSKTALDVHGLPAPTIGISGLIEGASKELTEDLRDKFFAKAKAFLSGVPGRNELLAIQREEDRKAFQAKKAAELEKVERKLRQADAA
jgi:hypothetical protein